MGNMQAINERVKYKCFEYVANVNQDIINSPNNRKQIEERFDNKVHNHKLTSFFILRFVS